LLLGKVSVVTCILDFKSIDMFIVSSNDVGQRIETGVADRNPHSKEFVLLQDLDQRILTVKAASPPPPKSLCILSIHLLPPQACALHRNIARFLKKLKELNAKDAHN
jgi:hypothetical protein